MRFKDSFFLHLFAVIVIAFMVGTPVWAGKLKTPSESVRVIIQLSDAPLAAYKDTLPSLKGVTQARTASGHLDVKATASQDYLSYLNKKQDTFVANLRSAVSNAQVQWRYRISLNGVNAKVPRSSIAAIRKIPGVVAVSETLPIKFELDESRNLINLPALWSALPPDPLGAGAGRRVAIIDSGANANNPFFDDTGFTAPTGYPVSFRYENGIKTPLDTNLYASNKVIVANVYIFPGDTNPANINPFGPGSDHGTHVGGIATGVAADYDVTVGGQPFMLNLSGMAPGAFLMSYRITGDTAEMVAAIEDVIADQADAVNLSLGHSVWLTTDSTHDPIKIALESAADAGVVVNCSAGNAGANGDSTITGSWKNSEKIITVAASTIARVFSNPVSVTGNPAVDNVVGVPGGAPTPPVTSLLTDSYAIAPGGTGGNAGLLCGAGPFPEMNGNICLASRGTCTFNEKKNNCQNNGGVALIVHQNSPDAPSVMGGMTAPVNIPAVMITRQDGQDMVAWGGTPEASIDITSRLTTGWPDLVTSFSSRGPTATMGIKPDISAPGNDILSSIVDANGDANAPFFGLLSGTSMSTPHMTGISALMKALHPTWTPAQIKSAMMNTANTTMFLDIANTIPALAKHRGGGRVNAARLVNPQLTFDPPSVSFGLKQIGENSSLSVTATDMRAPGSSDISYNVGINQTVPGVSVSTSSSSFTVGGGQSASFNINLGTTGALAGDYEGFITITETVLNGGVSYTIPYFVRVQDPALQKEVLLIDWDLNIVDYRPAFEASLNTLGITYDVFNGGTSTAANGNAGVTYATLQNYGTVILFMGDNFFPWSPTHTGGSFPLQDFVTNGGKLILIGQDWNSQVAYSQNTGSDFLLSSMAGFIQTDFDIYGSPDVADVLVTQFNLLGEAGDVSVNNGGDGAENQFFPDSGRTVRAEDAVDPNITLYNAANIAPHARVLGSYTTTTINGTPVALSSTAVSTGVAPDLTLENEEARVNWSAAIIHVGTEGLNTNLGADLTMTDAIEKLYNFVNDEVTVSLSVSGSGLTRTFTATASSALGAPIASYRWDFGDGSAIEETTTNEVNHTFPGGGAFHVRVQATNDLTRSSVASKDIVIFNACPNPIVVDPQTLPDGAVGVAYNATVTASGGTDPYTFAVSSGTLPDGLSLDSNTGDITGTPTTAGTSNFDITATDSLGCTGTRSYTVNISGAALFSDDYEDSVLDPNYVYTGTWTEDGDNLNTTATKKNTAILPPSFTGCLNCTIQTSISTTGGNDSRLWIYGWRVDKDNTIELMFKPENGKVILREISGGTIVKKTTADVTITPGTFYAVTISFNGTQFDVSIDGTSVITHVPAGTINSGTAGFGAKKTGLSVGFITIQ